MQAQPLFTDRAAAGSALARALSAFANGPEVVVLGLARGGIPVARPVADALGATLDVAIARKLGVPGIPEVALGAVAEGSRKVVGDAVGWYLGVPRHDVARIAASERKEVKRRAALYRAGQSIPTSNVEPLFWSTTAMASGATLRAAALALRSRRPAKVIVAVPLASARGIADVRAVVDDLIALATPEPFGMVSDWYNDFSPVADSDVLQQLGHAVTALSAQQVLPNEGERLDERVVAVPVDGASLARDLGLPDRAPKGLVVFAHGGGSSRNSYRNRYLAGRLRIAGYATLRVDC